MRILPKYRCHYLGEFASEARKCPAREYQKTVADLAENREKYNALKTKDGKMGIGYEEKAALLRKEILRLEPFKDQITLSQTGIKRVLRISREIQYNIVENISNSKTEKGLLVEDDCIELHNRVFGTEYIKNTERFENDFLNGEPDVVDRNFNGTLVVDNKAAWNLQTFDNKFSIDKNYYWQVNGGYNWLLGAKFGRVAHVLVNTPIHLIMKEFNDIAYKYREPGQTIEEFGFTEEGTRIKTQIFRNHIFSNAGRHIDGEWVKKDYWKELVYAENLDENFEFVEIPEHKRVKIFHFERDDEHIAYLKKKLQTADQMLERILEIDRQDVEILNIKLGECEEKATMF